MRRPARAATVLVGLALLVGGCGGASTGDGSAAPAAATAGAAASVAPTAGGGDPATGGASLDVCALIAAADVEAILGEAPEAGIDGSSGDLRVCSWTGAATPTEGLTISIYVHPDAGTAREQYLATTEGLGGVEILNLADEASYSDAFGLRVLSGRYDLGIDSTADDEKVASLTLAQLILPRLP
jgi:hypothetical protein